MVVYHPRGGLEAWWLAYHPRQLQCCIYSAKSEMGLSQGFITFFRCTHCLHRNVQHAAVLDGLAVGSLGL